MGVRIFLFGLDGVDRDDFHDFLITIFLEDYTHRQAQRGAVFDKMTELCALKPASLSKDDDRDVDGDV